MRFTSDTQTCSLSDPTTPGGGEEGRGEVVASFSQDGC